MIDVCAHPCAARVEGGLLFTGVHLRVYRTHRQLGSRWIMLEEGESARANKLRTVQ